MSALFSKDDLVGHREDTLQLALIQEITPEGAILRDSSGTRSEGHNPDGLVLLDRALSYDDHVSDINDDRDGRVLNIAASCTLARYLSDGTAAYATPAPEECLHTTERFNMPHCGSAIIYRGCIGRCEEVTADHSVAIVHSWRTIDVRRNEEMPPLRVPMETFRSQEAVLYPFWMTPDSSETSGFQRISNFSPPVRLGREMLYQNHRWIVIDYRSFAQIEWSDGSVTWRPSVSLEPVHNEIPRIGARLGDVIITNQGKPGHIIRIMTGRHSTLYIVRFPYSGDVELYREDFRRFMYNIGESEGDDGHYDLDLQTENDDV